jgi:iron complex outermembrane receptor protein
MNSLKFLLVLCVSLVAETAAAQSDCNIRFSGTVWDRNTGRVLSFATVVEMVSGKATSTDQDGHFVFETMCSGSKELVITHIGCAPEVYRYQLKGEADVNIYLSHSDHDIDAVEIVEHAARHKLLTGIELRSDALDAMAGKPLAELALQLPGMRMLQTGNSIAKPVFRGMHSNRLLLMNSGIRQEGQYWGAEHAPEVDAYIAQSLTLLEGPDALRYASDAIAGVLLVEPADVFSHQEFAGKVQTALQTNGRGGSLSAEVSGKSQFLKGLHFRVQGSLKKLGAIRDSERFLINTGSEEWNYSYALGYALKRWKAEVFYSKFNQQFGLYRYSHLGNLTDLQNVLEGRPQPDTLGFSYDFGRPFQRVSHELFKVKLVHQLNSHHRFEWIYARQFNSREEFDVHAGRNPSAQTLQSSQLDYGLTTHLAEALWQHERGRMKGTIGAAAIFRRNTFTGRNFMPNYSNRNLGIFWIEKFRWNAWRFATALRYDRYNAEIFEPVASLDSPEMIDFDGWAVSAAVQRVTSHGELTLSVASQWRAPAVNEMYSNGLHHGAGGVEVGNSALSPERSYNASLSYRATYGLHKVYAVAHVNFIQQFIFLNPKSVELTIRGAFPRFDFEQADALFRGFDLSHEISWTKRWSSKASASLLWANNLDQGTYFIGIPAHRFDLYLRHQFDDGNKLKGLYAGLRTSYTLAQYRAPSLYPFDEVRQTGSAAQLPASFDFAAPPDGYFLLGADAGFRFGKNSFSLTLENALNTAYRDYMNRFRYFADEMGVNLLIRFQHQF